MGLVWLSLLLLCKKVGVLCSELGLPFMLWSSQFIVHEPVFLQGHDNRIPHPHECNFYNISQEFATFWPI
jgi:hypothetical protein